MHCYSKVQAKFFLGKLQWVWYLIQRPLKWLLKPVWVRKSIAV